MMNNLDTICDNEYFASANGFFGFTSYFGRIFNSSDFKKIIVLKGGPGTGKSTIMKKVCKFADENKLYYEVFRCSSDLNSLDGVIVRRGGLRVAILDGTAPHERDAIIPGAIDEIVNLGEFWDSEQLEKHKDQILDLNKEKSAAYKSAYEDLAISSVFENKIKAEISSIYDYEKSERICNEIAESIFEKEGAVDIRLISSFSKDGYRTLPTLKNCSSKMYSVRGKYGSDKLFLRLLYEKLSLRNKEFLHFPSPLDKKEIEAVYSFESRISITGMSQDETLCDTTEFLRVSDARSFEKDLYDLCNLRDKFLGSASSKLKVASSYHFALEDIYIPCMNFDGLTSATEKIMCIFKKALCIPSSDLS